MSIYNNPPGRKGSAAAAREQAVRQLDNPHTHARKIEGFIVGVIGMEGTGVKPGENHYGSCWFEIMLKQGKTCIVESAHSYGELRTSYGSNGNILSSYCVINYFGSSIEDIARGKATIVNHGAGLYQDEDKACAVFTLSALGGGLQEDASYNFKAGQPSKVTGE